MINFAVIGVGSFGKKRATSIKESNNANLYGVFDKDENKLKEIANELNVLPLKEDEIFTNNEIDVICICAPNKFHKELIKKSIINNKHVFCEKPLVKNYAEAQELSELSKNYKKKIQIGSNHTSGLIIDLIENDAFFEVGGWGDGQSPGESYLDGYIKKVQISTKDDSYEYILTKENRDNKYFIYLPKTNSFYDNRNDGKIIFSDDGIKLKRPRSYWIAVPNQTNISKKDFEIVIQLKVNNIPKGNETLFSQSSIINTSKLINNQSWKWSIIDGRMYFFWIEDIVSGYSNYLGGQSLRSGKLISSDGKFDSIVSEFSLSQYDEITTSHNGFLTMGVEYGLFPVLLIICSIFFALYKNLSSKNQLELCLLIALLTQNLTNDLIYSPDVAIYFWIIPTYLISNLFKD